MEDLFLPDDNQEYNDSETVETYKNVIRLMMDNFSEKKYKSAIKIGSTVFKPQEERAAKTDNRQPNDMAGNDCSFSGALKNPLKLVIIVLIVITIITIIINLLK